MSRLQLLSVLGAGFALLLLPGCHNPDTPRAAERGPGNNQGQPGSGAVLPAGAVNGSNVLMMEDPSITSGSLEAALERIRRAASATIVGRTAVPAVSAQQVFPQVQRVATRPLLAMTEYRGWFWFATDFAKGSDDKAIGVFIGGYAVQKGDQIVWKWSVL